MFVRHWITEAARAIGTTSHIRIVEDPERAMVIARAREQFVDDVGALFWWEHLIDPVSWWQTERGYRHLPRLAPEDDCWLIAGLTDDDSRMVVVACTPLIAAALMGECPAFEYALLDRPMTWMIIENHHDTLFGVGTIVGRMNSLRFTGS